MDDEYDIYGDLDGFEVQTQKENKVVKELNAEIEELKAKIVAKESEKEAISKKNEILLENISSLLLTAKTEIKRKDTLIADIRRQKDDHAFRRSSRPARRYDKSTQTASIRLLDQEAQTESVGTMTEVKASKERSRDRDRRHSRSRSREKNRRKRESSRYREITKRNDTRDRIHEMKKRGKIDPIKNRRDSRALSQTIRERERERDRRARHREKRSPKMSPVKFPSMLRKPRKEVGNADSISEAKLAGTFIPMNERELDHFVKEMSRCGNRSPDRSTLNAVSNSDMWDVALEKQLPKKINRESRPKQEDHIIQSDEIGTTAIGASLSPAKVEDVEQKMRALHGDSTPAPLATPECIQTSIELFEGLDKSSGAMDTLQPATLVIPPEEPLIFEKVPELPSEDDQRLNDSRELRIVESEDAAVELDDDCNSVETVIEKQMQEAEQDLEEGELVSSDESQPCDNNLKRSQLAVPEKALQKSMTPKKEKNEQITKRRNSEAKILLTKLPESVIQKHSRSGHHRRESNRRRTSVPEAKDKSQYDCLLQKFTRTSTPSRRRSLRNDVAEKKISNTRLSEPILQREKHIDERTHVGSKRQAMKDLFGSDDETSLLEPPPEYVKGKRRDPKNVTSADRMKQEVGSDDAKSVLEPLPVTVTGKRRHSKNGVESTDSKKQKTGSKEKTHDEETAFQNIGSFEHVKNVVCDKMDTCVKDAVIDSKPIEPMLQQLLQVETLTDFVQTEQLFNETETCTEKYAKPGNEVALESPLELIVQKSQNLPEMIPEAITSQSNSSHIEQSSLDASMPSFETEVKSPSESITDHMKTECKLIQDTSLDEPHIQIHSNSQSNKGRNHTNLVLIKPESDKSEVLSEDSSKPVHQAEHEACGQTQPKIVPPDSDPPETALLSVLETTSITLANPTESQQNVASKAMTVFSNKYSEFRIEDNNESETTIYVIRKKKKGKRKSGNISLNVSG